MKKSRLLAFVLMLIMVVQPFGGIAAYAGNEQVVDYDELPSAQSGLYGAASPTSEQQSLTTPVEAPVPTGIPASAVTPTQYTVTFEYLISESVTATNEQKVNEGESATPPASIPQKLGDLQFIGWDKDYTCVTSELYVKAKYVSSFPEAQYVTVTFVYIDSMGEEKVIGEPQRIIKGESAVAPVPPQLENKAFLDWDKTFTTINEDTKITANYKSLAPFTVTINYVNEANSPVAPSYTAEFPADTVLPISVDSPILANLVPNNYSVQITKAETQTITVIYSAPANVNYTVEHYKMTVDGSGYEGTAFATDTLSGMLNAPANIDYKTQEGFTAQPLPVNTYISADAVIKVFYTRNAYTIKFDSAQGSYVEPKTVYFGAALSSFETTRPGYAFKGWLENGAAFTAAAMHAREEC